MNRHSKKMLICLVVLLLWGTRWHLHAQRTLNPSEDWNCQFDLGSNWLDLGPSFTAPPGGANGQFTATLNANLPPGTVLRCELYEVPFFGGPAGGQPIATFSYTSAPPNTITGWVAGAWQDQEGTIRFTALNGPATIQLVDLEVDSLFVRNYWYYHYLSLVPPVAPPRLSVSYSSASVQLRWWTNVSTGYVLETANAVAGTSWLAVNASPTISNAQKFVTLNTTGTARRFFRLRK